LRKFGQDAKLISGGQNMSKRKQYSAEFKAKVALAALSNQKTIAQLCAEFGVHQTVIARWKNELKEEAASIFSGANRNTKKEHEKECKRLYATIGKLVSERDFLAEVYRKI